MFDKNELRRVIQNNRKKINFESTADDMKRIVEYQQKSQSNSKSGSNNPLSKLRALQEPQHHFELSIDGIRIELNGTIKEAQDKLYELSKDSKKSSFTNCKS